MSPERSACTKQELIWGSLAVQEVSLGNHSALPFDLAFYEVSLTIILDRRLLSLSYNFGLAAFINILYFKA